MTDNKFSQSGFKYPERIYGLKFQHNPAQKPALLRHLRHSNTIAKSSLKLVSREQEISDGRNPFKQIRYSKFGINLGPERPVQPIGKFTREQLSQSPITKYLKEETKPSLLDMERVS